MELEPASSHHSSLSPFLEQQLQELQVRMNQNQDNCSDLKELDLIINRILGFPSLELAEVHMNANRLGLSDLDRQQTYQRLRAGTNHDSEDTSEKNIRQPQLEEEVEQSAQTEEQERQRHQICGCCGFLLQNQDLPVCSTRLQNIHHLGISTYVYFKTISNLALLLFLMLIIYSLYSLITNIISAKMDSNGNFSEQALEMMSISLGSKELHSSATKQRLYVIGAWIGVIMLISWVIVFLRMKFKQKEVETSAMFEFKTAAHFSVVLQDVPAGITKQQMQEQLDHYLAFISSDADTEVQRFQVEKYTEGKPFFFNEDEFNSLQLSKILEKLDTLKETFRGWIEQRQSNSKFLRSQGTRNSRYEQYEDLMTHKQRICGQILETIRRHYRGKQQVDQTTAFLTLGSTAQRALLLEYNPNTLASTIKQSVFFCSNSTRLTINVDNTKHRIKIYPAPNPQDILWENIGVSNCEIFKRKMITYGITLIFLALSFVIVLVLSFVHNKTQNKFVSIGISLSIALVNPLLVVVIQYLTKFERDFSMTSYQTSLAIKSIVAQILNSIVIPILANKFIKNNIYERGGLIEDIFLLSITNSLVYPIIKLVDPLYILQRVKFYYYARPIARLGLRQYELNSLCERLQFEVGYQYIYLTNLFIFTCFFVSLQPIIPVFAMLGLLVMYWTQKRSLLKNCQRPIPGTKMINLAMAQIIYFGAVAFILGSMTWANFLPTQQFKDALLPNLFGLGAALIIFLLPYQTLFSKALQPKKPKNVKYADTRLFFTSEYDRLNPATAEQGIREYKQFLQNKKQELLNASDQLKRHIELQLEMSNRPNFLKPPQLMISKRGKPTNEVIEHMIHKQSKNILTPQLIASAVLPNHPLLPSFTRTQYCTNKYQPYPKKERKSLDIVLKPILPNPSSKQQNERYLDNIEKIQSIKFQKSAMGKSKQLSNTKNQSQLQKGQRRSKIFNQANIEEDSPYFNEQQITNSVVFRGSRPFADLSPYKYQSPPQQIKVVQGTGPLKEIHEASSKSIYLQIDQSNPQRSPLDQRPREEMNASELMKATIDRMRYQVGAEQQYGNRYSMNFQELMPVTFSKKKSQRRKIFERMP